jgi:RimJ/RimL family protein N-acetyltransferase
MPSKVFCCKEACLSAKVDLANHYLVWSIFKHMEFHTQRLWLKPLMISHAEALFAYRSDEETNRFQGWIPDSLEEVQAFIKKQPKTFNLPDTWFQMGVFLQSENRLIGDLGIHFVGQEKLELGITIAKAYHRQGFAREAFGAIIDYAFTEVGKKSIHASIDPENIASRQLLLSLGFQKTGFAAKSLFLRGEWRDDEQYTLLVRN